MKKGRYCSTARQSWMASGGSRRVCTSKHSSMLVADGLAHRLELFDGARTASPGSNRSPCPIAGLKRTNFQPSSTAAEHALDQLLDCATAHVRVADHLVAHQAAEQLVDRDVERLALDVPQRDVDGRERRPGDTVMREEEPADHALPEVLDPHRVFADKDRGRSLRTHRRWHPPGVRRPASPTP